jgi:trigger factor
MQISVERTGNLERKINVQVPSGDIEGRIKQRLQTLSRRAKVDGFRPGKVPLNVIERLYGSQVRGEVLEEITKRGIQEAVNKEGLKPAGPAEVMPQNMQPGQDYQFVATLEEMPEFEVANLAQLTIERPVADINEADVAEVIEKLRMQRADWKAVERAAQKDDRVSATLTATAGEGEQLPSALAEPRPVTLVLGTKNNWQKLDEVLHGAAVGNTKAFSHSFPEDHPEKDMAGKTITVHAKVDEIEEPVRPAVDAEFIQSFGVESGELADLQAEVRRDMEKEAHRVIQRQLKTQVADKLCQAYQVEVPKVLIKQELYNIRETIRKQNGDKALAALDQNQAGGFEHVARNNVAVGLLLRKLVEKHELVLSRDRVKAKIEEIAAQYEDPNSVRQYYSSQREALRQLEVAAMEEQVIEWLLTQATVADKAVPFAELIANA